MFLPCDSIYPTIADWIRNKHWPTKQNNKEKTQTKSNKNSNNKNPRVLAIWNYIGLCWFLELGTFETKMSDVYPPICAWQSRKSWCHGKEKSKTKRKRRNINEKSGSENEKKMLYNLNAVFIFCSQPEDSCL